MRQNTLHYDCFAGILRKSNQVRQHNGYRNTEKVQLPKRALHQCVLLFQGNRWRYVLWTWKKYFQATYQRINIQNILTSQKVQQQINLCSEEMHEGPQQTVHKRRTIANKYMRKQKSSITSHQRNENQNTRGYHLIFVRLGIIQKTK